jgi:hypothetical protein
LVAVEHDVTFIGCNWVTTSQKGFKHFVHYLEFDSVYPEAHLQELSTSYLEKTQVEHID